MIDDPRRTTRGNLCHKLNDIFFLVISASICGVVKWKHIELFGRSQLEWLRKFVPLEKGVPSHDTLGKVFAAIDHDQFNECFINWTKDLCNLTDGEVIAIDGKSIRGSSSITNKAVHIVSAFASQNGICIGQSACEEKSNEITAIPALLDLIAIKGCTVTIDAMGCQTKIAEKIRSKEADYIIAIKENQKELCEQANKITKITDPSSVDDHLDAGHGRVEKRKCSVYTDLRFLDLEKQWKDLSAIVQIESERFIKADNKKTTEKRLYITSLNIDAADMNTRIREHWGVENKLHWNLDVNFGEDGSQKRIGNSAKNFNIISKMALTLIQNEKECKISKAAKILKAALEPEFREKVLRI